MFDLWAAEHSVLREKVLEHVFLADLSKTLLLDLAIPFEVLRSEFDGFGYDVVVEARGILRHIQLKATRIGGKRANVDIAIALTSKPGGCVVWFMVNEHTLEIGPFYWLGGAPGEPLAALGGRIARHTRGGGERSALRVVQKGKFIRMETIAAVALALFGDGQAEHLRLIRNHLAQLGERFNPKMIPDDLRWDQSADIAHIIDGYQLAEVAGLGDPNSFLESAREKATRDGVWRGTLLELWVALFLEHRSDHFSGLIGLNIDIAQPVMLDALVGTFVSSLKRDASHIL